jgi:hypothetical protein
MLNACVLAGKAEGILFEDSNDGYDYRTGGYLLTTYEAVSTSGQVTVRVQQTDGNRRRPQRKLSIRLLLEDGAEVKAEGWDGEEVTVALPSQTKLREMVAARRSQDVEGALLGIASKPFAWL